MAEMKVTTDKKTSRVKIEAMAHPVRELTAAEQMKVKGGFEGAEKALLKQAVTGMLGGATGQDNA